MNPDDRRRIEVLGLVNTTSIDESCVPRPGLIPEFPGFHAALESTI